MTLFRSFIAIFLFIAALSGWPGLASAQDGPPSHCVYVEQDGSFETEGTWQFAETASAGFLDATVARSGARSAFVGIPVDAENLDVDSTVWQEMQLPAAGQITATLWLRSQAGDGNDKRYIVVWDMVTDESTVLLYEQVPEEDWREISIDLNPFAGKDILLVVGVHNDGAGLKAGMWVDDVHVLACDLLTTPPAGIDSPEIAPLPTATFTPTATASPTPTPTAPSTSSPTETPTASPTATLRPTRTPTPTVTSSPPPSPAATPDPGISPPPQTRRELPDNNALPLLAGVFFSGLVAVSVIIIKLRR